MTAASTRSSPDHFPVGGRRAWELIFWLTSIAVMVLIMIGSRSGVDVWVQTGALVVVVACYLGLGIRVSAAAWRRWVYVTVLLVAFTVIAWSWTYSPALLYLVIPQIWLYLHRLVSSIVGTAVFVGMLTLTQYARWGSQHPVADIVVPNVLAFAIGCIFGISISWLDDSVAKLRRLNAELTAARAELAADQHRLGQATERERMSREIHDTLAQGLVSIVMLAQTAQTALDADHPARPSVDRIASTARQDLVEARRLVEGGAASAIEDTEAMLGLAIDRFEEESGLLVTRDLSLGEIPGEVGVALLRCLQESLANVRRHARASRVWVHASAEPTDVVLRVEDDGRGIGQAEHGFGIAGLHSRAHEMGGRLQIGDRPGGGTRVEVRIPQVAR